MKSKLEELGAAADAAYLAYVAELKLLQGA